MVGTIFIIIFLSLVGLIALMVSIFEGDSAFLVTIVCGLLIWFTCEHNDYREDFPKPIPHSELQVRIFDEVAIIRHHNRTYEYNNVREYKAIIDGVFVFTYIQNYDMLGEFNGRDYKLVIRETNNKEFLDK